MSKEKPDYQDAELVLKVYEMRREAVMRESRNAINGKFFPKNYDDFLAIAKPDHPLNAAFRQTGTYWEMVYGIVKHGIVNAEYFLETNGEGLLLYTKVLPFLEQFRKEFSPTSFQNAEWVTKNTETGKRVLQMFQARLKMMEEMMKPK